MGREGLWRFAVAGEVSGVGSALVYRSADFLSWERTPAPLHASTHLPAFECTDLFPVAVTGTDGLHTSVVNADGPEVRHVLKLSKIADEDYYMVGHYDDKEDTFVPAEPERGDDIRNWRRLDHGHLFGAKSFFDSRKNRRVIWAWVDETDGPPGEVVGKDWTGILSFPRRCGWIATGSSWFSGQSRRSRR